MRRPLVTLCFACLIALGGVGAGFATARPVAAAAECADFPQTGQQLCGKFLTYWREHGGLAQQGYPLSALFTEQNGQGGTYQVQYFERAIMELHPENAAPYDVLLSLVGRGALQTRYPSAIPTALGQPLAPALGGECAGFVETGQQTCGAFLAYWREHGGLAQQGYPLTGVFTEQSASDGQTYQVQYFERAVFEYHAANSAPHDVQLSQLGRSRYAARYPNGPGTIDTEFVSLGQFTLKSVPNNYVEWSAQIKNISGRPLLSALITIVFLDANGNQLDTSIAGATNLEPNETRTIKGLSVKGLGYATYRVKPPEVLVKP